MSDSKGLPQLELVRANWLGQPLLTNNQEDVAHLGLGQEAGGCRHCSCPACESSYQDPFVVWLGASTLRLDRWRPSRDEC